MRISYLLKSGMIVGSVALSVLLSACTTGMLVSQPDKQDRAASQSQAKVFGCQFRLIRPADNLPVANKSYEILNQDGIVVMTGVTNEHGETSLYKTEKIESVSVRFKYSDNKRSMQCQPL